MAKPLKKHKRSKVTPQDPNNCLNLIILKEDVDNIRDWLRRPNNRRDPDNDYCTVEFPPTSQSGKPTIVHFANRQGRCTRLEDTKKIVKGYRFIVNNG